MENHISFVRLLNRKPSFCTICKKSISHKNKPKREWNIDDPLCSDCYINEMQKHYESSVRQKCVVCGIEKEVPDLWEPRWQWEMKGLLCKACFDKKDELFNKSRNFCSMCGTKLGVIRYNPKKQWSIEGQLCKNCWDAQKAKSGS